MQLDHNRKARPQGFGGVGSTPRNEADWSEGRIQSFNWIIPNATELGAPGAATGRFLNAVDVTEAVTGQDVTDIPFTLPLEQGAGTSEDIHGMVLPMALRMSVFASVSADDNITIRVIGRDQFGAPVHENFAFAGNSTPETVDGIRIFSKVDAIQVVERDALYVASGITVSLGATMANPIIGLPMRTRLADDVISVILGKIEVTVDLFDAVRDFELTSTDTFAEAINLGEQSIDLSGLSIDAADRHILQMWVRTSMGDGRISNRRGVQHVL